MRTPGDGLISSPGPRANRQVVSEFHKPDLPQTGGRLFDDSVPIVGNPFGLGECGVGSVKFEVHDLVEIWEAKHPRLPI